MKPPIYYIILLEKVGEVCFFEQVLRNKKTDRWSVPPACFIPKTYIFI
ncbi:hypothetical protein C2W64_04459 [Brevibacillus laterosporus]|nr:hypothetical protein C2W64_04459 [Brevibacillus laterosporus]